MCLLVCSCVFPGNAFRRNPHTVSTITWKGATSHRLLKLCASARRGTEGQTGNKQFCFDVLQLQYNAKAVHYLLCYI